MTPSDAPSSGLGDRIAGQVKGAAGALLGDEQLAREAELHEERADAKHSARARTAEAEEAEARAELAARERDLVAEEDALARERAAQEREDRLAAERRRADQQIEQSAE